MTRNQPLFERYRPASWSDVVGQDKAIKMIQTCGRDGFGGQAYWLRGASGTGKTTIARILAKEVADSFWTTEMEASDLTIDRLREIEDEMHYFGGGKGGRAFIVNESHGLRGMVVRKLNVMFEPIPPHVIWIFTTTNEGEETLFEGTENPRPLLGRCHQINLARRDLAKPFAALVKGIAEREGLDGQDIQQYVKLAHECKLSAREMLDRVQRGCMFAD